MSRVTMQKKWRDLEESPTISMNLIEFRGFRSVGVEMERFQRRRFSESQIFAEIFEKQFYVT